MGYDAGYEMNVRHVWPLFSKHGTSDCLGFDLKTPCFITSTLTTQTFPELIPR